MMQPATGGFEYDGRAFHFQAATCSLEPGGYLHITATGRGCGLRLVGVPFPGVASVAELAGRIWEPDEDELARHADVFAEGGLTVRSKDLWITRGRISCTRFDSECHVLSVSFRLSVRDGEYGRDDETMGIAHCQLRT